MSSPAPHPASQLPASERADYYNAVAGIAIADGNMAAEERQKIGRLGEVLELPEAMRRAQLDALGKGRTAAEVTSGAMLRIRDRPLLRTSLMMDAIVIAFSDGKLMPTESRQLGLLASALGIPHSEVLKIAQLVERILFGREAEAQQLLTAEFGEALAGAPAWLRRISGLQPTVSV